MRRYQILSAIFIVIFIVNLTLIIYKRAPPIPKKQDGHTHTPIVLQHSDESDEHLDTPTLPPQRPPLISVVVPMYNQLRYLQDAIDSILMQEFEDFEIIIVDDGSTEWTTRSVLNSLKTTYPGKVSVVFKTNGGLSDARNAGMKVARGQWLLPLDADDLIGEGFFQQALQIIQEKPNVNVVISDLMGVDAQYTNMFVSEWRIPEWEPNKLPKENLLHCCPLFKKELWLATDGYNPAMLFGWEDWEFWISVNSRIPIVPAVIEERLFKYRIKPGMHSFCSDYYRLCYALLQTTHPELYPVEEIFQAHNVIIQHKDLIEGPIRNKLTAFCDTVALHLWTGILKQASGGVQDALLDYDQAQRLADTKVDWQPLYFSAIAKKNQGAIEESKQLLTTLFTQFPQVKPVVEKFHGLIVV